MVNTDMRITESTKAMAVEEMASIYARARDGSSGGMTPEEFKGEMEAMRDSLPLDKFNEYMDGVAKIMLGFSKPVVLCPGITYEDVAGLLEICKDAGISWR